MIKTLVEQYVGHVLRALDDPKREMLTNRELLAALEAIADEVDRRISDVHERERFENEETPVEDDNE